MLLQITTVAKQRLLTVLGTLAQLLHSPHAVDGQFIWVTVCAHFFLVHVDHMLQFWNLRQHILCGTNGKRTIKTISTGVETHADV